MASTGSSSSSPVAEAAVDRADIVIGVASYNSEATVGDVVRDVRDGIRRHFREADACLVLADGGSTDRTLDVARQELDGGCHLVTTAYRPPIGEPLRLPYHGLVGRSEAIRTIFEAALAHGAKACTVIDAGLSEVNPDGVARLITPVLEGGIDYASAYYLRHPYEGALTKSIVHPVFRALFGARLHQPATGEFGCSSRLIQHCLDRDFWSADGAETGIDLWIATAAAMTGFRMCESALGVRTQAQRPGATDVRTTLTQVVGALFAEVERRAGEWQRVRASVPVPQVGDLPVEGATPLDVDVAELIEFYQLGYTALREVWAWILPPKVILALKRLADAPRERFRLEDDQWARIIYDFALGYRMRAMPRDHLLGALTPLYLGWLASFILDTAEVAPAAADARVERLAEVFEREKPYLISRWRWPDRFRA